MTERRLVTIMIAVCFMWIAVATAGLLGGWFDEGGPPTPYGCAWVDMNPSKPYDPQLACVPGYFPEESS